MMRACYTLVLYPAPLRDFLMQLAQTSLIQAKWSNDIHEEWIYNLLKNRKDLRRDILERTRKMMDGAVRDCLVTGYEKLIPDIQLPDKNDRHVLAAAIKSEASTILTFNIKDFPYKSLKIYGIEAKHPDKFLSDLINLESRSMCDVAFTVRNRLKNPPKNVVEYLNILEKQDLMKTVSLLRKFESFI